MSCHRIGLGMNSVVEKSIEIFENEEIGLNACKKIIVACRNGIYWCDGNEDEAIACIIDCYCGNCLRKLHQEHRICVDRNRYDVVTHYLCEDCYQHLVYEESILKKHVYVEKTGIIKKSDFLTFYFEIISTPSSVTRKVCSH